METIRVVYGHDCSDIWPLLVHVENGRILRVEGDHERPFSASFARARVNYEVQPAVVLVVGRRLDSEATFGTTKLVCSDRYTDMDDGATYQSILLDVLAHREAA